jgi:hypothetical protein
MFVNVNGKVFTGKLVGTGPSSYEKRIYRAARSSPVICHFSFLSSFHE